MNDLRVCAIQADLAWEDPQKNYAQLADLFPKKDTVDVVVLPEMFTTGFTMFPEPIAEVHSLSMETLEWMKKHATALDAAITGSVSVKDGAHYMNRLYWVEPVGTVKWYDKIHLFTFAGEDEHYKPGKERMVIHWRGWKILPLICYDLRFPELARNRSSQGEATYDLCLYVANWPAVRSHPWSALLVARAIENQCYLIGCNRVGLDGNSIAYTGDSVILNAKGESLENAKPGQVDTVFASLSKAELLDFRMKFPVLEDQKS